MQIENTAVAVVHNKEGKILLVKRGNRTFHGWWCLPGGHSEKGETPWQNAQREANEEIGSVKVEKEPFMVFLHDWPGDSHSASQPHKHNCHVFRGKVSGVLKAGDDAGELRWFTLEEARKLKLTVYTQRVLHGLEPFDVVNDNDEIIGKATRHECHSNRKLIHRAVSILVFNSKGDILFERRSMKKDMEPGAWGLVAGHVDLGESYEQAAKREMMEEVGISCEKMEFVSKVLFRAEEETEMIKVFSCRHEGPFKVNKEESDEVRFFPQGKIKEGLKSGSMRITQSDTQILKKFFAMG